MGKIYYLMGKSSSGKDTIYRELIENEKLSLKTILGYTTRPIREGEKEGVECGNKGIDGCQYRTNDRFQRTNQQKQNEQCQKNDRGIGDETGGQEATDQMIHKELQTDRTDNRKRFGQKPAKEVFNIGDERI